MTVSYRKAKIKSIIKSEMKRKWQEEWDKESKGPMLLYYPKKSWRNRRKL